LLADSELELVPKEYWGHPAVGSNAKKRGKKPSQVLLDSSVHHPLFKEPYEKSRRGRPDIVHQFLLMGLDSILNTEKGLTLWVHTRNDQLMTVSPETRLPKNYARYQGLFEELLISGAVPSKDKPLLKIEEGVDLEGSVARVRRCSDSDLYTILFHDKGDPSEPHALFKQLMEKQADRDYLCIIGGFSVGDLRSKIETDRRISIHAEMLKVWSVEMEILCAFRWAR
jgi:rRNA small subunit pseudouridine methyltransferase Nep1